MNNATATGASGFSPRAAAAVERARLEVEKARKDKWNILISEEIRPVSEIFLPFISVLRLSADPEDGDFYFPKDAKGKGRMTYHAMKKIGDAADVQFIPSEEGITRKEKDYVAFRSVGKRFSCSGEVRTLAGFSDKDTAIVEENLRSQTGQYKKEEGQIQGEMRKERTFSMRKAESGARGRVIKGFVPIKSAYSTEQIEKPFVVVRYIFSPDLQDAIVKTQVLAGFQNAATSLYGPQASAALPPAQNGNIHDATFQELPADAQQFPEAPDLSEPPADDPFAAPADPNAGAIADFEAIDSYADKISCIMRAMETAGYKPGDRPAHLRKAKYTDAELLELFTDVLNFQAKTKTGF